MYRLTDNHGNVWQASDIDEAWNAAEEIVTNSGIWGGGFDIEGTKVLAYDSKGVAHTVGTCVVIDA
ncbi:hypothetical protein C731_2989 [Mycolicibacterium hassiacum DSM 44199]|uniref:Uncharacterized protein n=1 Tax=Mycolicibacterium hassiacum (strain DSM 44199 / CIP 105218 / JCM 12690 / 3849) TaxID=1122247 RepID=K5BFA4_MYCHD|nr:hypothetical protein [Mycolicibacterium hassiacum]EKF22986.1 hypothetical protein C731_2989 [Mycolicibacterium hassiacum DSM 44199]MDA4086023.1 hypothetical protein [Mycolicibacterium hassiacum DSM 44199]VCT89481.1 hypothetical protein MHAS_01175 [Mycolicibacterium hassiacum DSM 44199]